MRRDLLPPPVRKEPHRVAYADFTPMMVVADDRRRRADEWQFLAFVASSGWGWIARKTTREVVAISGAGKWKVESGRMGNAGAGVWR